MWDSIWINVNVATMSGKGHPDSVSDHPYGLIKDGVVAAKDGEIVFVGERASLENKPENMAVEVIDCGGACMTPGLIDCHTHLVYGGNRAREFEMRLEGASYEDIARAGGGIISTVKNTRDASDQELYTSALKRLKRLAAEGVTTIEIKSGYGLNMDSEVKMLRVARKLGSAGLAEVKTTFLGAHALPPEFKDDVDGYLDLVCDTMLPEVASEKLADAVDAFCEGIAFSPEQTRRVFEAARHHGLPVKLHADQLSDLDGAALAAEFGALSADHLEYTNENAAEKMAKSGTVAVLLPGAFYVLKETKLPPMDAFRKHNVPIAIATDSNPGSSPVTSILLMLSMACRYFSMTPEEAFAGITRNAAKALGLGDDRGTIEGGKRADLCLFDIETPAELAYNVGANPLVRAYRQGRAV
ncbi:MAG: imidazolonepropionase [Alphaproteobacteria bacterium]|nr:imidazolonepropionase [Alphaproteobacteria bacterium]